MNSLSCPPCTGECNQGRVCPARISPAFSSWVKWRKRKKETISVSYLHFLMSISGRSYRAGYDAAMADTKKIVKDGEEWKLWGNDQA